jgi:hypothetical protein
VPAGWTKASTHNDKALRVVTGSASSGGSNSFSGQFVNPFSLGSVTILQANLPSGNVGGATTGITVSAITGLLGGGGSGFAAGAQGGSAIPATPTRSAAPTCRSRSAASIWHWPTST